MIQTPYSLLDQLRQAGQPDAWGRFVFLYTPLLLKWARRQGLQGADAEDLVQEVLMKLVSKLPSYDRAKFQSFRGWLFRVCENQCRDYRRRILLRQCPRVEELDVGVLEAQISELDGDEYRLDLVRRGLDMIQRDFSPSTWTAFTELVLKGRPVEEVASQNDLSVGAVYQARHRVLARLRQELEEFLE